MKTSMSGMRLGKAAAKVKQMSVKSSAIAKNSVVKTPKQAPAKKATKLSPGKTKTVKASIHRSQPAA